MLNIQHLKGTPYHGWQIKIVQECSYYVFQCYPPTLRDFCGNGATYASFRDAFLAAREFVDREIAIQSLFNILEDWLERDRISCEEYWNLTNFD